MNELPKIYNPKLIEDKIYQKWEDSGFFNPDNISGDGETYSIMMPPPNVTGVLHLGHALENSVMDTMARFQRMNGKKVLLLPGTDHAAVATQAKVEKILIKEGIGNPREQLGRAKLLKKIRSYSEESKSTILNQIRKMGTSCDWSRLAYTFDGERNTAVNNVFEKMYKDGLIYRGYRVINWSVKGQSTCSDDELVHIERKSKIYTFKYSKDFPISIATTRPETKLGDTAIAVNPSDVRYKKYIGKKFMVDVGALNPLSIKVIGDENVDPKFGTGALGVTPAHSPIDFEVYEKQKALNDPIGIIPVIDQYGLMTEAAGTLYCGLDVENAREKFVKWLKKNDLLEKEEEVLQSVGTSDRFGDVVEAIPMTQWFVDVNKKISGKEKTLKELMKEAVTSGHNNNSDNKIEITPERFEKLYLPWIDNLRDWCISRQVWWGHRIPIWYRNDEIIFSADPPSGNDWRQDPDTLDTWFSSGLWTFSTLGWPKKNSDLEKFHPTSWMQMGYEILFFWMARMILMSTYTLDEIPFKKVYIHGMLRDEKGQKFSKSLGNTLDPISVIDEYGCDALRLSLLIGVAPGNDSKFYEEKVENSRNFINKLWNISKFIIQSTDRNATKPSNNLTLADNWILEKLQETTRQVTNDLNNFQFSQAAEKLREFTWNDFADWYMEISKIEQNEKEKSWILNHTLETILKLWHPFIPFFTENMWGILNKKSLLLIENWPNADHFDSKKISKSNILKNFEIIKEVIVSIRNARTENNIDIAKKIKLIIDVKNQSECLGVSTKELFDTNLEVICGMRTGVEEIEISTTGTKLDNSISRTVGGISIYIQLTGLIDIEKEKEKAEKEIQLLSKYVAGLEGRLKNKDFISKAPEKIIQQQKESLKKAKNELQLTRNNLAEFDKGS